MQFLGLPLPQDQLGAVLRYQTDHDEAGRATSCGPRTSRLMVQVLANEAIRLETPFVAGAIGVRILIEPGPPRRLVGLLAMRPKDRSPANPMGFVLFLTATLVIAAGGPGELYRDSVYPKHCFGALGFALRRESKRSTSPRASSGSGRRETDFRGICRAPMRRRCRISIPSTLAGASATSWPATTARPRNWPRMSFARAISGRSTRPACWISVPASSISRSSASGALGGGCSWISTAIPEPARDGEAFSLNRLDPDVELISQTAARCFNRRSIACATINPLSIELYRRYKKDITRDPLEFAVNNQHMNGGIAAGVWGETELEGCYAVGEAAGTHGVTRPAGRRSSPDRSSAPVAPSASRRGGAGAKG